MPFAQFQSLLGLDENIIKQGAVTLPPTQARTLGAMLGSMEDLSAKHGGEDMGQNTEHGIRRLWHRSGDVAESHPQGLRRAACSV